MEKRLARGDEGINPLDSACKEHDIAYASTTDTETRYLADKKLEEEAMKRVVAKDASIGERATALGVSAAMKAKRALTRKGGKGLKKKNGSNKKKKTNKQRRGKGFKKSKKIAFNTIVKSAKQALKSSKPINIETAVRAAVKAVKQSKHGKQIRHPRIIRVPSRMGGSLPLVPVFTGLSALGSIGGGVRGIVNGINDCINARNQLNGNAEMESIAIGDHNKVGDGIYLHVNKTGKGLYISSGATQPKNQ